MSHTTRGRPSGCGFPRCRSSGRYIDEEKARRIRAGAQDGFVLSTSVVVDVTKRLAMETKQMQINVQKKYNIYNAGKGKVRS